MDIFKLLPLPIQKIIYEYTLVAQVEERRESLDSYRIRKIISVFSFVLDELRGIYEIDNYSIRHFFPPFQSNQEDCLLPSWIKARFHYAKQKSPSYGKKHRKREGNRKKNIEKRRNHYEIKSTLQDE